MAIATVAHLSLAHHNPQKYFCSSRIEVTNERGIPHLRYAARRSVNQPSAPVVIVSDYRLDGDNNDITLIAEIREILNRDVSALLITGDMDADTDVAAAAQYLSAAQADQRASFAGFFAPA